MSKKTPEGEVKKMIRKHLEEDLNLIPAGNAVSVSFKHNGWYYMPVSNGMGVHGIPDFLGHYKGNFFAIEAKKDAKTEPTPLQQHQLNAIDRTGAVARKVGSEEEMKNFIQEVLA